MSFVLVLIESNAFFTWSLKYVVADKKSWSSPIPAICWLEKLSILQTPFLYEISAAWINLSLKTTPITFSFFEWFFPINLMIGAKAFAIGGPILSIIIFYKNRIKSQ